MAHFRGTITGQRGAESRLGSKNSGLETTADGWTGGVRVVLFHRDGRDHARVTLTRGSGYEGQEPLLFDGPIDKAGRDSWEQARWITQAELDECAALRGIKEG